MYRGPWTVERVSHHHSRSHTQGTMYRVTFNTAGYNVQWTVYISFSLGRLKRERMSIISLWKSL